MKVARPHPLDETLAHLIAPVTVERFMEEFWGTRALVVPGTPGKFARYYDEERWYTDPPREATAAYPVEEDGVRVSKEVRVDAGQLPDMYEAGLVTMGHVEHVPEVADLLDDLRASFQVPTRGTDFVDTVLCFRSKDNVGWSGHWDVYHVFVLQIAGRKRWRYSRVPLVAAPDLPPAPGATVAVVDGHAVMRPSADQLEEVVLADGDFLYMPPGTWHAPLAEGHSCHLAVAIGQLSIADVMVGALRDHLISKPQWRAGVPALTSTSRAHGAIPADLAALFADRIAALGREVAAMDARLIHQRWGAATAVHAQSLPPPTGAIVQPDEHLGPAGRAPIRFVVGPARTGAGQSEVFLYSGQNAAALPEDALRFVRGLAAQRRFVAKSAAAWDPDLPWEEVQQVLTDLVDEGILRRL